MASGTAMQRFDHQARDRAPKVPPGSLPSPDTGVLSGLEAPDSRSQAAGAVALLRDPEVLRYTKSRMLRDLGVTQEGREVLAKVIEDHEGFPDSLRLKAARAFHKAASSEFIRFLDSQPVEAPSREIGVIALGEHMDQEALRFLTSNLMPGNDKLSQAALLAISNGCAGYNGGFPFPVRAAEAATSILRYVGRERFQFSLDVDEIRTEPTQFFDRESLRGAALGAVNALTQGNDRLLATLALLGHRRSDANFMALEILHNRNSPELPQVVESLIAHSRGPRELTRLLDAFSAIGLDSPVIEKQFLDRRAQMFGARVEAAFQRFKFPFPLWAKQVLLGPLEDSFASMREVRERRDEDRLFWGSGGAA